MARPKGSFNQDPNERRGEWMLVRQTALLGDIVDEITFAKMCGVSRKDLRNHRTSNTGEWWGVPVPQPICRPEYNKPIFLRAEAETFATKLKALKPFHARGKYDRSKMKKKVDDVG